MNIYEKLEYLEQSDWTYRKTGEKHFMLSPHPLWNADKHGNVWCSSMQLYHIIEFCYEQENKWRQENDS